MHYNKNPKALKIFTFHLRLKTFEKCPHFVIPTKLVLAKAGSGNPEDIENTGFPFARE